MSFNNKNYISSNWLDYVKSEDSVLLGLASVKSSLGSGKGGQKKNKTSNSINIKLFNFQSTSEKYRSKTANIKDALRKLRLKMAIDKKNLKIRKTWVLIPQQLLPFLQEGLIKIATNNKKYPIFVGVFRDLVWQSEGDKKKIATFLGVSRSQVDKWDQKHFNLIIYYATIKHNYSI